MIPSQYKDLLAKYLRLSNVPKSSSPKKSPENLTEISGGCTWSFASEYVFMYPMAELIVGPLRSIGLTPNAISVIGLFNSLYVSYLLSIRYFYSAIFWFAIHGVLDAADGTMARRFNMCSPFGAALDMNCDLISGVAMTLAIFYAAWGEEGFISFIFFFGVYNSILAISALAYDRRDKSIKYVEHLSLLEYIGLIQYENITYIVTVLIIAIKLWFDFV